MKFLIAINRVNSLPQDSNIGPQLFYLQNQGANRILCPLKNISIFSKTQDNKLLPRNFICESFLFSRQASVDTDVINYKFYTRRMLPRDYYKLTNGSAGRSVDNRID